MKEKTNEPIPLVRIEHSEHNVTEIFVLDEGDSMAWNSSTNYDHHMRGPSLVTKNTHSGSDIREYHVNDPEAWKWINHMMRMGKKYLEWAEGAEDFDAYEAKKESDRLLKEEYPKHRHVSMHKEKS